MAMREAAAQNVTAAARLEIIRGILYRGRQAWADRGGLRRGHRKRLTTEFTEVTE
jgi:hypothetical protein